jgi:hypothetical protein
MGLFVVSFPGYIAQLQTICTGGSCNSGQLSPDALTTLQHIGLSLGEYVAFNVALILIATLLVALMLVFFVPGSITNTVVLSDTPLGLEVQRLLHSYQCRRFLALTNELHRYAAYVSSRAPEKHQRLAVEQAALTG